MSLKLWLKVLLCVATASAVSIVSIGTVHVVRNVSGYYYVNNDNSNEGGDDWTGDEENDGSDDENLGGGDDTPGSSGVENTPPNDEESDNDLPDDNINNSDNETNNSEPSTPDNPEPENPDPEPSIPDNPEPEIPSDDGDESDGKVEDDEQVVLTSKEKCLLLIANSDAEIYRKFEYFILPNGIIDGSKVNEVAISEELDILCENLLTSINAKCGNVDKITSEMVATYVSISNLLDDIFNLFVDNMI